MALDTTNILGRGAVKDTYNLLADGIVKLARVLAKLAGQPLAAWAEAAGVRSVRGPTEPEGDGRRSTGATPSSDGGCWGRSSPTPIGCWSRRGVARTELEAGSAAEAALVEAAGLLSRVLVQDVERRADGPALKQGVAKDRLLSVHDPEMRHGRKSASKRFDGHKAAVAVDTDEPLITAVAVLPGNAPGRRAGAGAGRADRGEHRLRGRRRRWATAPTAAARRGRRSPTPDGRWSPRCQPRRIRDCSRRRDFALDLEAGSCTCPGGQTDPRLLARARPAAGSSASRRPSARPARSGPSASRGTAGGRSRSIPRNGCCRRPAPLQASPAFAEYRRRRQVVEHRIARLVQLGIRQARDIGTDQDAVPTADGRGGGQPDAAGEHRHRGERRRDHRRGMLSPSWRSSWPPGATRTALRGRTPNLRWLAPGAAGAALAASLNMAHHLQNSHFSAGLLDAGPGPARRPWRFGRHDRRLLRPRGFHRG